MWTYIKHNADAEAIPGQAAVPPAGTVYQAFDAFRWKRVIGITESGGHSSFLNPDIDDDCAIIAFAPLDEPTAPDECRLREAWTLAPCYPSAGVLKLYLRANA